MIKVKTKLDDVYSWWIQVLPVHRINSSYPFQISCSQPVGIFERDVSFIFIVESKFNVMEVGTPSPYTRELGREERED